MVNMITLRPIKKGIWVGDKFLTKEEAIQVHHTVAQMGWCEDKTCPSYETGYRQGQEDVANKTHEA